MPKLIVLDAGSKRAFRLSKGRLTVGSAEEAKLTLSAPGVEPAHAAITIRPDGGVVDASAEVRIDGQPALGEGLELRFGAKLEIGEASLELEADDAGAQPAAAAKPAAKSGAKPAARAGAARSGTARAGAGAGAEGAGSVRRSRSRAEQKQGLPSWAIPAGVVAVLVITFLIYRNVSGGGANPIGVMAAAERSINDAQWNTAREQLATLNPDKLSPDLAERHASLVAQANNQVSQAVQRSSMTDGIGEFGKLLSYQDKWLKNEPYARPNAHYFLDKLDAVRAEYPEWDSDVWRETESVWTDIEAVLAIEEKALAALGGARIYDAEDVNFRLNLDASGGTSGKGKRDFRPAFAALSKAMASAQGSELSDLQALKSSLEAGRAEYAQQRLSVAKADMQPFTEDPKDLGALMKSASKLTELIFDVQDANARNTALGIFTKLPKLDLVLASFEEHSPERFAQLMGEPAIRTAAESIGYGADE